MARTTLSNGPLASVAQIKAVGRKIAKLAITQYSRDAALLCERRPHMILGAPEIQERVLNVLHELQLAERRANG